MHAGVLRGAKMAAELQPKEAISVMTSSHSSSNTVHAGPKWRGGVLRSQKVTKYWRQSKSMNDSIKDNEISRLDHDWALDLMGEELMRTGEGKRPLRVDGAMER